jgi:hypothetical protein
VFFRLLVSLFDNLTAGGVKLGRLRVTEFPRSSENFRPYKSHQPSMTRELGISRKFPQVPANKNPF